MEARVHLQLRTDGGLRCNPQMFLSHGLLKEPEEQVLRFVCRVVVRNLRQPQV